VLWLRRLMPPPPRIDAGELEPVRLPGVDPHRVTAHRFASGASLLSYPGLGDVRRTCEGRATNASAGAPPLPDPPGVPAVTPSASASARTWLARRRRSMTNAGCTPAFERTHSTQPSQTGAVCTHATANRNELMPPRAAATRATRSASAFANSPLDSTITPVGDTSIAAPATAANESTWGARTRARSVRNGERPPGAKPSLLVMPSR
jgi:hypothetical protein